MFLGIKLMKNNRGFCFSNMNYKFIDLLCVIIRKEVKKSFVIFVKLIDTDSIKRKLCISIFSFSYSTNYFLFQIQI